ncbi:hypothetical protein V7654_03725 [Bacillus sp. JJ1609]|uniref:hypothetical protein n=1 Tax=Bacillus sp. JJ1609 TaxID=3122977 RepID=UPI002FFFF5DD
MGNLNFGKYSAPETLKQLIDLQADLHQKRLLPYEDLLGYYFSNDEVGERYLNTPVDLISFARPGMDGIHYGFLTDFGLVEDLENAYIVRVSPMDFDDPVKIVAWNLRDFMRMLCYAPASLNLLDISSNQVYCKEVGHEDSNILEDVSTLHVRTIFRDTFQLEPMNDIYSYLKSVKDERTKEIVVPTNDGVGVVNNISNTMEHPAFDLNRDSSLEIDKVKFFLEGVPPEAKLAFIRDVQSFGLVFDNDEVKAYFRDQLLLLNLPDEAERIMFEV